MRRAGLVAAACAALLLTAAPAHAARGLITGFVDGDYGSPNAALRNAEIARTVQAGAGIIRLTVNWSAIAPAPPANAANPGDPAYNFGFLDSEVRVLRAAGLQVLLTAGTAPAWAEGPGRPAGVAAGSWKPQAPAFGQFGRALATRYGGAYPDPQGGTLPRVSYFQAWNEPNLSDYITPQWQGRKQASPAIFRDLLNAFYDGVKAVHADDVVVTGGVAPYGDAPGGQRMRPLVFLRTLLCVKNRRKLKAAPCPVAPKFDVLADHPINTSGGPGRSAINPDDASTPDVPQVMRILRAADRRHRLTPRRHDLWITEFWWNTNPPNTVRGVSPVRQARWIEDALYLFWKAGAKVALNLQLVDSPFNPSSPLSTTQSGLFFVNGTPKPSLEAFRFPFVSSRASGKRVRIWGKAPVSGRLEIQRLRGQSWVTVSSLQATAGSVFTRRLKLRSAATLRAVIGAEVSLSRRQR
jgi:hypothetical protein